MIKLRQAIVVEGGYDKKALCQLVDAPVIETHGFGVMKDRRLLGFLRQVAAARGLIILTDSDGAGFVIRNFLKGALPPEQVLFVGDQIFTDCLAAHRAGVDCYLVKPIKSKETFFFRLKRAFEKPFLSIYRRRRIKSKGCN